MQDADSADLGACADGQGAVIAARLETALLRAGALQSAIFDSANVAAIAIDEAGVIRIFGSGAEHMLGHVAAEIVNRITAAAIADPDELAVRAKVLSRELAVTIAPGIEALTCKAARGLADICALTWLGKDGSRLPTLVSVSALRDAHDVIIGYLLIGTASKARREADDRAEQGDAQRRRIDETLRESEERFRRAVEAAPHAMITVAASGLIEMVNAQAERMFGYERSELLGEPVEMLLPPRFRGHHSGLRRSLLATPTSRPMGAGRDLYGQRKDGSEFPVEIGLSPIETENGVAMLSAIVDISVRKEAERALESAAQFRKLILDSAPSSIIATDPDGLIVDVNPAAQRMLGYARDELVNRQIAAIIHDPDEIAARAAEILRETGTSVAPGFAVLTHLARHGATEEREWTYIGKDGSRLQVQLGMTALRDGAGATSGYLGVAYDISERKRQEAHMRHVAHHDALTGLPNRTLLRDRAAQAITVALRRREMLAILFLDLDRFKDINDSMGHEVGDQLLQSVARRLASCVRGSDTISRQGGDEFAGLLLAIKHPEDAGVIATKMIDALLPAHSIGGHQLHISVSIGISIYPDDGVDVDNLIKNADLAMYHAKESGRNNFQFFAPEMNARAVGRLDLEHSLRTALERREFVLHYQPKMDLETGRIAGAEALIRWQHPDRGLLPPAQFVATAEESGLIRPIGQWVLREACQQARNWQDAGLPAVPVAVNISAVEFRGKTFFEDVRAILDATRLEPRYLELELTESVLMQDAPSTIAALQALKALGVRLSVDDFGTGYSSLSYLRRFPIDTLKIDRTFVNAIATDPDDATIVSAVIGMARILHLRVIAEGVETQEQLTFLRSQGCDEGQGYFFGRPMVAAEFARLLAGGLAKTAR